MASLFKKDNSRFWYATWRHCERKPQRSTGVPIRGAIINGIKESPSQARSRAQAIADGYEAADKEGTHSVRVKATIKILAGEAVSNVPTIHDFLSNFPDRAKDKVSRSTTNNRKTAVTLFLKYLGSRASLPLTAIHRRDIIGFVEENLREVRAATVRKYLHSLGPAFRDALDLEYIEVSPINMIRVENPKFLPKIKKGAFTPEEVKRMLQVLPSEWRSMVICCLYTGGQRIGDVALLRWEQIDMERRQLSLVTGKTGRSMSIPIVGRFMEHLRSIPRNGPYLHPRMAEKYLRRGAAYISYQFRKELEYAGITSPVSTVNKGRARAISPKTFHSLRATAATLLHLSGVSPAIAQKVVGHESMDVHEGYVRPDDVDSRNAMEKLSSALAL